MTIIFKSREYSNRHLGKILKSVAISAIIVKRWLHGKQGIIVMVLFFVRNVIKNLINRQKKQ